MISQYIFHVLIIGGIYLILAVSLNLALGYTGLLNLGHIAFFGIGAYTSALLTLAGVPFGIALLCAGLLASLFGLALGWATKRLKGDYFALATLGFSFIVYSLLSNLKFTHGQLGISGIPKPNIFGIEISSNLSFLIFTVIVTVLSVSVIFKIVNSPFGRLLKATRDDEIRLRVLGKDTNKLKYKSMALSAFFAGIAGSLFAHYITFIDPSSFYFGDSLFIIIIVIIGGLASIKGSIAGTFIILLIPEALRFLSLPSSIIGPLRQIMYALILLSILIYRPRGIFGRIDLK